MRRHPPADQRTPPNDWLARADQDRTRRDAAWRQQRAEMAQEAAARNAWRPEAVAVNHVQRVLRGTRDR